jgi:hypothetical protein
MLAVPLYTNRLQPANEDHYRESLKRQLAKSTSLHQLTEPLPKAFRLSYTQRPVILVSRDKGTWVLWRSFASPRDGMAKLCMLAPAMVSQHTHAHAASLNAPLTTGSMRLIIVLCGSSVTPSQS